MILFREFVLCELFVWICSATLCVNLFLRVGSVSLFFSDFVLRGRLTNLLCAFAL